jgi:hypothetical protein
MSEKLKALETLRKSIKLAIDSYEAKVLFSAHDSLASYMGYRPSEEKIKERFDELWKKYKITSASLNGDRDTWTIFYTYSPSALKEH